MAKSNAKTTLVTGSTDGVGREVALRLGGDGWRVLIHGRDRERGKAVVAAIEKAGGTAEFIAADLSTLAEVRRLADAVQKTTQRLDLLINNAGIGSGGPQGVRQESADGYELRFAVNYLSGFLLAHLLLPLIEKSAPARRINVSSRGQPGSDLRAYRQSKLAQILFTLDLAHDLKGTGVTVTALHPATFMNTAMVRQFGTPMSTVEEGADAIMRLAVSGDVDGMTGLYFNGQREAKADPQAYDAGARQKLKALSLELSGLKKANAK
jgi:NAD(P)-dependent dehydrogenase (short-subunit alcohol dehydrogenase family)